MVLSTHEVKRACRAAFLPSGVRRSSGARHHIMRQAMRLSLVRALERADWNDVFVFVFVFILWEGLAVNRVLTASG